MRALWVKTPEQPVHESKTVIIPLVQITARPIECEPVSTIGRRLIMTSADWQPGEVAIEQCSGDPMTDNGQVAIIGSLRHDLPDGANNSSGGSVSLQAGLRRLFEHVFQPGGLGTHACTDQGHGFLVGVGRAQALRV
jgi:hypothetical protein